MKPTSNRQMACGTANPQSPHQAKSCIERLALSINEAARALSVSRTRLYELVGAGEIKSFTIGRRRLIQVAELQRFIADRAGVDAESRAQSVHSVRP